MPEFTFRDFAGAVMSNDAARAAVVLQDLLALTPDQATAATAHFQSQMTAGGPAFMGKAMGLRTAVTGGSDADIASLLGECFDLHPPVVDSAVAKLRAKP